MTSQSRKTPADRQTGGVRPIRSNKESIINQLTADWQVSVTCRPRHPLTHLLLTDEQLISPQNHEPVLPDLSEDPFPAELPDPADLIGLSVLLRRVLQTLNRKQETVRGALLL